MAICATSCEPRSFVSATTPRPKLPGQSAAAPTPRLRPGRQDSPLAALARVHRGLSHHERVDPASRDPVPLSTCGRCHPRLRTEDFIEKSREPTKKDSIRPRRRAESVVPWCTGLGRRGGPFESHVTKMSSTAGVLVRGPTSFPRTVRDFPREGGGPLRPALPPADNRCAVVSRTILGSFASSSLVDPAEIEENLHGSTPLRMGGRPW